MYLSLFIIEVAANLLYLGFELDVFCFDFDLSDCEM